MLDARAPPPAPRPEMPEAFRAAMQASSRGPRVRTMAEILNEQEREDNEEAKKRPEYLTHGGDHSAQKIIDPRDRPMDDLAAQIIGGARQEQRPDHDPEEGAEGPAPQADPWAGHGVTLGGEGKSSQEVGAPAASRGGTAPAPAAGPMRLTFWKEGFTVDDGPLYPESDPHAQEMMRQIRAGHVPEELMQNRPPGTVNVEVSDHRFESYKPKPGAPVDPFSTGGYTCASAPAPARTAPPAAAPARRGFFGGPAAPPPPPPAPAPAAGPAEPIKVPAPAGGVTIQVRLHEGPQASIGMPATATVADLVKKIKQIHPRVASFELFTPFPRKVYTGPDMLSQTLAAAGLNNTVLIQRPK
eukprot:GAFH01002271.1.p1 GENE.GAFH01002271.1~~GAFH01002271.1.p1  ORF type:complete len:406 (+),score=73.98 GAFH01002271.1:151-1218(+)